MQTIALRFADNFAPPEGTIAAHSALIEKNGYTWYGKMGSPLSSDTIKMVMESRPAKVLLIHSGTQKRYWAYVDAISREYPGDDKYPDYYADRSDRVKTWLRVIKFKDAPKDIMSKCTVMSSGALLSYASRHSMSPYFRIEVDEDIQEGGNEYADERETL